MSSIRTRSVVTILSILAFIVSVVVFVWDKIVHHPLPIWDVGLMVYGGVFCAVMWMDSIGKQASRLRSEFDAQKRPVPRPIPKAGDRPEQHTVSARGDIKTVSGEDVSLQRVSAEHTEWFLQLVDRAIKELMALDDQVPSVDETGHVAVIQEEQWLSRTSVYCFLIRHQEEPVGCCVLDVARDAQICLLYVEPRMRHRGVGRLALSKLTEFVRMLGVTTEIEARVSPSNLRAQRFLEACGFRKFEQYMSSRTSSTQSQCGEDFRASVTNLRALHLVKTLGEYAP